MQTKLAEILEHLADAQAVIGLAHSWCNVEARDKQLARDLISADKDIDNAVEKLGRHVKEEEK